MFKKIVENPHLQTILSSKFLPAPKIDFSRETIKTKDKDFIDIDWVKNSKKNLILITHGLEGSSKSPYIRRFINRYQRKNFDFLAWNFRSCSGRINQINRFYHAGDTDDLSIVINHIKKDYDKIFLLGFSLGGNLNLLYGCRSPEYKVKAIAAISAPVDLKSSAEQFQYFSQKIYMKSFINSLIPKIQNKNPNYKLKWIKDFHDFDKAVTAKLHGFKDENDYWNKSSFIMNAQKLKKESLLINAIDDPFLGPYCFPSSDISKYLKVFYPEKGGHVSFLKSNFLKITPGYYFMTRVINFFDKFI